MITQRDRDMARGIDKILSRYKRLSFYSTQPPNYDRNEAHEIFPYFRVSGEVWVGAERFCFDRLVTPEVIYMGYAPLADVIEMVTREISSSLARWISEKSDA